MNNIQSAAQFLGIPSGAKPKPSVRRGGGRHKAKTPAKTPQQQHADIGKHLAAGNLPAAKSASLNLVKALHAKTGSSKPPMPQGAPGMAPMSGPPMDTDQDQM